jgi:hypothetical protein
VLLTVFRRGRLLLRKLPGVIHYSSEYTKLRRYGMSLKRTLTTQERVDIAVEAGLQMEIQEHIRMHNAKGEGAGVLSVKIAPNQSANYTYLPDYAFAAIDCYLTSLGVAQYVEDVEPKASMLSMDNLQYANHCHEQAAYFESQAGKTYSGLLRQNAEYAAACTAFAMIEESIKTHPFEIHGNKLLGDFITKEVHVLKLANGRKVCRSVGEDGTFLFYKHDDCETHLSVDEILNHELNELANTLHDKGLGLN